MAAAIVALIAAGTLSASWRLALFARAEAERLAADGYCHDVMRRFDNMEDATLATHGKKTYAVPIETLPLLIRTAADGTRSESCILWRDPSDTRLRPTCTVSVDPCDADGRLRSSFDVASNALIVVSLAWGRSDDAAKTNLVHSLRRIRAGNFDRWKAVVE